MRAVVIVAVSRSMGVIRIRIRFGFGKMRRRITSRLSRGSRSRSVDYNSLEIGVFRFW